MDFAFKGKALIIYGPRQTGKTTLCKILIEKLGRKAVWLNGDHADVHDFFSKPTPVSLKKIVSDAEILVIDEAQRIANIGLCIKILVETLPNLQVIATGSSSLELAGSIKESLTGRKREFWLFPISYQELVKHTDFLTETRTLEQRLLFGAYPEVVTSPGKEIEILQELAGSYLYKDIFAWESLRYPDRLDKLVRAIALQVGSEVSFSELGSITGMASDTVERYITLLEQAFVIYRLPAFSRNIRNELKKSRKIYFYDNGIRNALLCQFTPLSTRTDVGQLWENYLISERIKKSQQNLTYQQTRRYFWRTTQQQEVDYIEEYNGSMFAFEFKWNDRKKAKLPLTFTNAYPEIKTGSVTKENYGDFLSNW
jgi:predicted AAA+ superfamily ATPase